MTYATTFSGIGGWELGLNACGWDLLWQCECEPFCRALLAERFGVPIYPDIRTLADERPSAVDCLIGSPPCQPDSVANPRRRLADERRLLPSFLDAVAFLLPDWLIMEQVPGVFSIDGGKVFGSMLSRLDALGFDAIWHCLPVAALGGPHLRERVWTIAHARIPRRSKLLRRDAGVGCPPSTLWPTTPLDSPGNTLERLEARLGESALLSGSHGLSAELALGGYGNAVVPQIPYLLGQAINEVECK